MFLDNRNIIGSIATSVPAIAKKEYQRSSPKIALVIIKTATAMATPTP